MPIRVLLADDEPLGRRRLLGLLRAEPGVEVVADCASGEAAVRALEGGAIDLVFLGVQLPDLDGFGVVARVGPARMPPVVFVTAHDEHALRAFEVHALDYLRKPVAAERVRAALARARDYLDRARAAHAGRRLRELLAQVLDPCPDPGAPQPAAPAARPVERLAVRDDGRVYLVRTDDVDWFAADGNYVRLHVGAATHTIRATIAALDAALPRERFARIHRSTIVNVDRVRELRPWSAGDYLVLLCDGTQLKLSRTYRDRLRVGALARVPATP